MNYSKTEKDREETIAYLNGEEVMCCISNKTPHIKCRLLLNYVQFCLKCRKLTFIYISSCY